MDAETERKLREFLDRAAMRTAFWEGARVVAVLLFGIIGVLAFIGAIMVRAS